MKIKNTSGKIITVFLVISAILLVSLTSVSLFFFKVENEKRIEVQQALDVELAKNSRINAEFEDLKRANILLGEKNKEADEKINGLLDEMELDEGIREELKKEGLVLREQFEVLKQEKEKMAKQIKEGVSVSQEKFQELEVKWKVEASLREKFETKLKEIVIHNKEISEKYGVDFQTGQLIIKEPEEKVELEKIVVVPDEVPEGRILSVDIATEFIIVNLGEKDGIERGNIMSVYRGKEYLGDVRITRVQPEMAAADLIPPFSSRLVRKNDQVLIKQ